MADLTPNQIDVKIPRPWKLKAQRFAAYAAIILTVPILLAIGILLSRNPWTDFGQWLVVYLGIFVLFTIRGRFRASWGLVELSAGASAVTGLLMQRLPGLSEILTTLQIEPALSGSFIVLFGLIAALKGGDTIDKAITTDWESQELGGFRTEVKSVWSHLTAWSRPKKRPGYVSVQDQIAAIRIEMASLTQQLNGQQAIERVSTSINPLDQGDQLFRSPDKVAVDRPHNSESI